MEAVEVQQQVGGVKWVVLLTSVEKAWGIPQAKQAVYSPTGTVYSLLGLSLGLAASASQ